MDFEKEAQKQADLIQCSLVCVSCRSGLESFKKSLRQAYEKGCADGVRRYMDQETEDGSSCISCSEGLVCLEHT